MVLTTLEHNDIQRLYKAWNDLFEVITRDVEDPDELSDIIRLPTEAMNDLLHDLFDGDVAWGIIQTGVKMSLD